MGYCLNRLDEPVVMAVPKPLLTEFGIHYRLESCELFQRCLISKMLYHPFLILKGILKTPNRNHPDHPIFFYRGDLLMAVRKGPYKMHMITWATPDKYLHNNDVSLTL